MLVIRKLIVISILATHILELKMFRFRIEISFASAMQHPEAPAAPAAPAMNNADVVVANGINHLANHKVRLEGQRVNSEQRRSHLFSNAVTARAHHDSVSVERIINTMRRLQKRESRFLALKSRASILLTFLHENVLTQEQGEQLLAYIQAPNNQRNRSLDNLYVSITGEEEIIDLDLQNSEDIEAKNQLRKSVQEEYTRTYNS